MRGTIGGLVVVSEELLVALLRIAIFYQYHQILYSFGGWRNPKKLLNLFSDECILLSEIETVNFS